MKRSSLLTEIYPIVSNNGYLKLIKWMTFFLHMKPMRGRYLTNVVSIFETSKFP